MFYLFYQFVILVCWRLLVWLLLMSVMADTSGNSSNMSQQAMGASVDGC